MILAGGNYASRIEPMGRAVYLHRGRLFDVSWSVCHAEQSFCPCGRDGRGETVVSHTPGPWEISWYKIPDCEYRLAKTIGPIAPDHGHWSGWTIAEEADALLVAAAPEMFALLKKFTEDYPSVDLAVIIHEALQIVEKVSGK
jgi:hypothetical protein